MSGHAQRNLALLREADREGIDVDDDATRETTIQALREKATELDNLRNDAVQELDGPLADTANHLRALAEALENGARSEHSLRMEADYTNLSTRSQDGGEG